MGLDLPRGALGMIDWDRWATTGREKRAAHRSLVAAVSGSKSKRQACVRVAFVLAIGGCGRSPLIGDGSGGSTPWPPDATTDDDASRPEPQPQPQPDPDPDPDPPANPDPEDGGDTTGGTDDSGVGDESGGEWPGGQGLPVEPGIEAEFCPDIVAEGSYCLVLQSQLSLVGLQTGAHCPWQPELYPGHAINYSFAWIGDAIYSCGANAGGWQLDRFDLVTGEVTLGVPKCASIAAYGDDIIYHLVGDEPIIHPAHVVGDIDALMAGELGLDLGYVPHGDRIGAGPDMLWISWPVTEELDRFDPVTGAQDPLRLEGHDGRVHGVARVDDEVIIVRDDPGGRPFMHELARFDADDGTLRGTIPVPSPGTVFGLACRTVAP